MLILQRKIGEKICIGEDITITLSSIDGNRVRLAIDAPKNVSILRSELLEARKANQEAVVEQSSANELLALLEDVGSAAKSKN